MIDAWPSGHVGGADGGTIRDGLSGRNVLEDSSGVGGSKEGARREQNGCEHTVAVGMELASISPVGLALISR